MPIDRWLTHLGNALFSPVCALCGNLGGDEHGDAIDLCNGCRADLPYNASYCIRCAIPLPITGLCGHCLREPPPYASSFSLFHYAPPVDHLIIALKFRGRLSLARLLGELMASALAARTEPLPELLIPVPLHRTRLRERGYNQALELARPIGRRCRIPIEYQRCHRVRATSAQTQLSARERRRNVKGAFRVDGPLAARVAIVDDVMTTGHTVQELTLALMRAGVERVEVWCCARALLSSP